MARRKLLQHLSTVTSVDRVAGPWVECCFSCAAAVATGAGEAACRLGSKGSVPTCSSWTRPASCDTPLSSVRMAVPWTTDGLHKRATRVRKGFKLSRKPLSRRVFGPQHPTTQASSPNATVYARTRGVRAAAPLQGAWQEKPRRRPLGTRIRIRAANQIILHLV